MRAVPSFGHVLPAGSDRRHRPGRRVAVRGLRVVRPRLRRPAIDPEPEAIGVRLFRTPSCQAVVPVAVEAGGAGLPATLDAGTMATAAVTVGSRNR